MTNATAERTRQVLVDSVLEFLSGQDLLTRHEIHRELERELDAVGPDVLLRLKARLAAEADWDYYPADPLVRRIHHLLADRFLRSDSIVSGAEQLAALAGRPVVVIANHLSYADANVIDVLLQRSAGAAFADRLTALAGPKVFSERNRRFSSLCFGTIKVPQSAEVSSEEAVLTSREVARAARQAMTVARQRLISGDALLIFAEGTRSRTAEMRQLLAGAARYLDVDGTWVVPLGLTGSETLFPIGDSTIRPCRIDMRIGRPLLARTLLTHAGHDRRVAMDAVGLAVADLLPAAYRGVYADPATFASARTVLAAAMAAPCDV